MAPMEQRAANTKRAYESDFAHFSDWCRTVGTPALPASPEAVYRYLMDLVADDNAAGYAVATVERRLAAIGAAHRARGHHPSPTENPQVRQLIHAIRRTYERPSNARVPLTEAQIGAMIATLDLATPSGQRDRALLLFGFASGWRRHELAALTVDQLTRDDAGYHVAGAAPLGVAATSALDDWLASAAIAEGPVFRKVTRYQTVVGRPLSPPAVAMIVKRAARAADLAPERLAAHSLRAGSRATAAAS